MNKTTAQSKERLAPAASGNRAYELIREGSIDASEKLEKMGWGQIMAAPSLHWREALYLDPEGQIHGLVRGTVNSVGLAESIQLYRQNYNRYEDYDSDKAAFDAWMGMIHEAVVKVSGSMKTQTTWPPLRAVVFEDERIVLEPGVRDMLTQASELTGRSPEHLLTECLRRGISLLKKERAQ